MCLPNVEKFSLVLVHHAFASVRVTLIFAIVNGCHRLYFLRCSVLATLAIAIHLSVLQNSRCTLHCQPFPFVSVMVSVHAQSLKRLQCECAALFFVYTRFVGSVTYGFTCVQDAQHLYVDRWLNEQNWCHYLLDKPSPHHK